MVLIEFFLKALKLYSVLIYLFWGVRGWGGRFSNVNTETLKPFFPKCYFTYS